VANKAKPKERDRRARVEAMRREQQARERRKSLIFVGSAVLVGLILIGIVAVPAVLKSRNDPSKKALGTFGVNAAAAQCDGPTTDKLVEGTHVDPGTRIKYQQVPPSSGPHWNPPVQSPAEFYSKADRPAMEELVHNLEHGYTIIWYDSTIKGPQLQALKDISRRAQTEKATSLGKFIVSAWDSSYGKFPPGKHVALSHWSANAGHRQLCGKASGDVVASFIKKFPASDAPEAGAP